MDVKFNFGISVKTQYTGLFRTPENVHQPFPCLGNKKERQSKAYFNNRKWRAMINEICLSLDPMTRSVHAISPFGFELTQDKKYLSGNLKRFYFYIGIVDKNFFDLDVAKKFVDLFFQRVKKENFFNINDVVLKIEQDKFIKLRDDNYKCKYSDKLVDVQCRYVDTSIMDYYCDYVICCLSAINENKDEPKEFQTNKRFRVRTYQLYVMLESLFGNIIQKMNDHEKYLYSLVFSRVDNSINIFFNEQELYQTADTVDQVIMRNLIKKRVALMSNEVQSGSDTIILNSKCLHVDDELTLKIDRKHYNSAVNKIKQTYWLYQ